MLHCGRGRPGPTSPPPPGQAFSYRVARKTSFGLQSLSRALQDGLQLGIDAQEDVLGIAFIAGDDGGHDVPAVGEEEGFTGAGLEVRKQRRNLG